MGVEKHLDSSSSASTRLNKSHSVDIYRPPALRRNLESVDNENPNQQQLQLYQQQLQKENETQEHLQPLQPNDKNCISAKVLPSTVSDISNQVNKCCNGLENATKATSSAALCNQRQVRRERRPDRAVYIPRARRSQTTPPAVLTQQLTHEPSPQQHAGPVTENTLQLTSLTATTSMINDTATTTAISTANVCTSPSSAKSTNRRSNKDRLIGTCNRKEKSSSKRLSIDENEKSNIHKINNSTSHHNLEIEPVPMNREQRKHLHEHGSRIDKQSTDDAHLNGLLNSDDNNLLLIKDCDISNPKEFSESTNLVNIKKSVSIVASDTKKGKPKMATSSPIPPASALGASTDQSKNLDNLRIEDAFGGAEKSEKCDRDAEELVRASKEINRSNRRIIKQTFNSDVLEIPENVVHSFYSSNKTNNKDNYKQHVNEAKSGTDDDQTEEDDWDAMYDDSGDCLDPKILQELTASVGKVKIELPKMDYSAYLTKQSILNEEEFPHVLEVSNFPVEFKNQDLLMVFSQYKESGFDIKWVDDTHALAVFSSSQIAAEVLAKGHPFVVLKPLAEATVESRSKAKKCSASLQPYRPRPETCAALARRLVTGALGVRLKTAPQERENEKRVLREAKERKLLAAKQRDEAWES